MNPRRFWHFLSLFVLSFVLGTRGLSAEPAKFVTAQGKRFLDPAGNPVLLRGINLGNWLVPEGYMFRLDTVNSPRLLHRVVAELLGPDAAQDFWTQYEDTYITREDIQLIRRAGFNSVRVPFNFRSFTPEDQPGVWTGRGFELLDRVVDWCREAGLWVILDLHCAPGGQTGDNIDDSWGYPWLFESPRSQEQTIALWRKIAEHFRSNPTVAAYDLLNEPIPHFFDTQKLNPRLEPLYRRLVSAIREVDPHHLIMLEGAQWASKFEVFSAPFDSRLVYSFHKYWTAPTQKVIQEYLDFSERHQVPLYMGESGENSDEWITQFHETLEQNQVSWCFWPYKKMDATSCLARIEKPPGFDQVIAYSKAPRDTFEQIRAARKAAPDAPQALAALLANCQLKKCTFNPGYFQALGMKAP